MCSYHEDFLRIYSLIMKTLLSSYKLGCGHGDSSYKLGSDHEDCSYNLGSNHEDCSDKLGSYHEDYRSCRS